jgi:hypothetical protein
VFGECLLVAVAAACCRLVQIQHAATEPKNGLTIKQESVEWTPLRSYPGALSVSIFLTILL